MARKQIQLDDILKLIEAGVGLVRLIKRLREGKVDVRDGTRPVAAQELSGHMKRVRP